MAARTPVHAVAALLPARLIALGVTGALALAACGSAGPTTGASLSPAGSGSAAVPVVTAPAAPGTPAASPSAPVSAAPSPGGAQGASLLLEVRRSGGFINPAATIGAPSAVVVDTDGRIFAPQSSADGSTPLIPRIEVRDTGPAGAAAVLAAARGAGLDAGGSVGLVTDAGSTVFTLETPDGSEVVTRIGSSGPGGPGAPGGSGGSSEAPGAAALALLARLTDTATPWPSSPTPAMALVPTAYEVWVAPELVGGVATATGTWPLSTDPNSFGSPTTPNLGIAGLRSGEVTGDGAATLARALGSLSAGADVAYEGHAIRMWVRPMLPDELGS